jgi:glycosyltransferase involved in cell wall biosynthesis
MQPAASSPSGPATPRILTNMAFWQSEIWMQQTDSLYDLQARRDPDFRPWWKEALALFRRRSAYDLVVTMGVRESMTYGLLCLLTGRASRQVMTEVFIDAPTANPLWHLKTGLYGVIARRAVGLLTNSSAEIDTITRRYRLPRARVRYVPLNTNIAEPQRMASDDGFVLSAGRTLRDYATLVAAAHGSGVPITIIAGRSDLQRGPLPATLQVLREVSRDVYLDHLRRCRLVALPLLPTERATGQVVMLEAMALGKPVVTTSSPGTVDYIRDGENGVLVPPRDPEALRAAIDRLWHDAALRRRIGESAVHDMTERASADRHAQLKLETINELWTRKRQEGQQS